MRFCQARSFFTSSRSAREAANARPRSSSGRFASSQPRTSLRNPSSRSVKSKFIGRRGLRPPLDSPAYTRGVDSLRFFGRRGLRPPLDSPAYTRGVGSLRFFGRRGLRPPLDSPAYTRGGG